MYVTSIASDLFMRNTLFNEPVDLESLSVGSNLDARGAKLIELDLEGARIKHALFLEPSSDKGIEWVGHPPKLTLRNAKVGIFRYSETATSEKAKQLDLELDGFKYDRLGPRAIARFGARGKGMSYEESSEWFIEWLARDKSYSPQPYLHLAHVLRNAGHEEVADDILYANREKQRGLTETSWGRWLLLSALKFTIGYGYGWRYFRALGWVGGLVILGMIILLISLENDNVKAPKNNHIILSFRDSAFYSLDMLLPVIRLRERHYEKVDLVTWARYYFYFHKIIGYVLIFFVIAGLAGLAEWGQSSPGSNMLSP